MAVITNTNKNTFRKCGMKLIAFGILLTIVLPFFIVNFIEEYAPEDDRIDNDKHNQIDDKVSHMSALSTLNCLVTPGCYPSYKCNKGEPKKLHRKKKFEEHSFCVDDLVGTEKENKECLVYSFGVYDSIEWELLVAEEFGCEVHAFDPTVTEQITAKFKKQISPSSKVTFHKLGLQGDGSDVSETKAAQYEPINPDLLLSLGEIMDRLGHTGRTLDVLKLDCEGCEWGVLRQLTCHAGHTPVDQIIVEMHFQKNLGIQNEADVKLAADAVNCLRQDGWGMVSMEGSGCGHLDTEFAPGMEDIMPGAAFLLFATLQKKPSMKQLLEDLDNYEGQGSSKFMGQFRMIKARHFIKKSADYDKHEHYEKKVN